jgi:putative SOS response-associated peptidase YedK
VDDALSETRLAWKPDREYLLREPGPLYNIAPSYSGGFEQLIVTRGEDGAREIRHARWWFIPKRWAKPLKELPTAFNARSEDIGAKPLWRDAFRSSRCLVPATGWREFMGRPGQKQPYHFQLPEHWFAFAGLRSTWTSPEGDVVDCFAIITTEANASAKPIHDRMPLIMPPAHYAEWLDPKSNPEQTLLAAITVSEWRKVDVYASNPVGNRPGVEGPEVIGRLS